MTSVPEAFPVPLPNLSSDQLPFAASPATPSGLFHHPWGTVNDRGPADIFRWKVLQSNPFAADKKHRTPRLPEVRKPIDAWRHLSEGARVQWLGHASVLIELQGQHVLIDPVFGAAGPGVPRLVAAPLLPSDLPRIDAILVTHGHYDHLDRKSIAAVRKQWPEAVVGAPRGLGRSIPGDPARIVELSWFEAITVGDLQCTLTPSQHWHLRRGWDRNRALWGGWMVQGPAASGDRGGVYHSGDTGWFDGFSVIQKVLGAPDVAVLPLGAYEPRWFMGVQHMPPEDSVQAFVDLGARHFLGMHWGTFDLSDEPVDHGAYTLLPAQVAKRGLPEDRFHVMGHGGVLGFGRTLQEVGRDGLGGPSGSTQ